MPSQTAEAELPVVPYVAHVAGCPVAKDASLAGRVEVYQVPESMRLGRDDGSPNRNSVTVVHCVECGAMAHERKSNG